MAVKHDCSAVYRVTYGFGYEGFESQVDVQFRITENDFRRVIRRLEEEFSGCRFHGEPVNGSEKHIQNMYLIPDPSFNQHSGAVVKVGRLDDKGSLTFLANQSYQIRNSASIFGLPFT